MEDNYDLIMDKLSALHADFTKKSQALSAVYKIIVKARESDWRNQIEALNKAHSDRVASEYSLYRAQRTALYLDYKTKQVMTDEEIHNMLKTRHAKFIEDQTS